MEVVLAATREYLDTQIPRRILSGTTQTESVLSVYDRTIDWEMVYNLQPVRDQEIEPDVIIKKTYLDSKWLRLSILSGCALGVSAIITSLFGSGGLAWGLGAWSIAMFGLFAARFAWMIDRSRIREKESGARSIDKECSTS